MTHENGKNIGGGAEYASPDERKIAGMLSSLKRVEAPKDFDFHLKARIANARPENLRPAGLFPILKYVLPLALFLFAGTGIVLYSSYNNWQPPTVVEAPQGIRNETAPLADNSRPLVDPVPVSSPDQQAIDDVTGRVVEPQLAAKPKAVYPDRRKEVLVKTSSVPKSPEGGSVAKTGGNASPQVICPKGMSCTPIKTREALTQLGIEADFENNSWTVKSVKSNEVADQLGVKPGDRIKAIDGNPINDKTKFEREIKVNTIQVTRNGTTIDLSMKKPE